MAEKGGVDVAVDADMAEASLGGTSFSDENVGFFFCDASWRALVTEFRPMEMKDEISGSGGIDGFATSSSSSLSLFLAAFASSRLRLLLLLPLDLVRWFVRCWPMGESRLWTAQRV